MIITLSTAILPATKITIMITLPFNLFYEAQECRVTTGLANENAQRSRCYNTHFTRDIVASSSEIFQGF